ncbi:MAG TPA: hypothetical protein VFC63_16435 [Blastocatellia bacterium]|nr:hypothetical protein [Blastocatellia bacterium]
MARLSEDNDAIRLEAATKLDKIISPNAVTFEPAQLGQVRYEKSGPKPGEYLSVWLAQRAQIKANVRAKGFYNKVFPERGGVPRPFGSIFNEW